MACLRGSHAVWVLILCVVLALQSFGQTLPSLRVDEFPPTAIPGSMDAELRICPNLIAHVLDAMNGIAKRPAGCGGADYIDRVLSLQAPQLLKKASVDAATKDSRAQTYAGALKCVQDAYALLPSLQQANGGFLTGAILRQTLP